MDVFNDFHRYNDPQNPNNNECLHLRAKEVELRLRKRVDKRNDWLAFAAGLIMLFIAGTPLEMIWEFGLGERIGTRALFVCCAGAALALFFLTAPWRHRGRQHTLGADIAALEATILRLNCPCASEKLDGKSDR